MFRSFARYRHGAGRVGANDSRLFVFLRCFSLALLPFFFMFLIVSAVLCHVLLFFICFLAPFGGFLRHAGLRDVAFFFPRFFRCFFCRFSPALLPFSVVFFVVFAVCSPLFMSFLVPFGEVLRHEDLRDVAFIVFHFLSFFFVVFRQFCSRFSPSVLSFFICLLVPLGEFCVTHVCVT